MNRYFTLLFALCMLAGTATQASPNKSSLEGRIQRFENALFAENDRQRRNPPHWTIEERLEAHAVPGVAVAVIDNYRLVFAKGYGSREADVRAPVDGHTLFSAGSVSKMVNAALILRLVSEGALSLDEDINRYLKSWKVKADRHTAVKPVGLREILSHTAGFTVHGFPDFQPGDRLPTVLDTLNGRYPARHEAVTVQFKPGTAMDYSGGGTTVSQLVATDTTGIAYPELAEKYVFNPLAMHRSTFENPLSASRGNIAHAHDRRGKASAKPRGWESMPEMAASGLWTSAEDMAKLLIALLRDYKGRGDFLPQSIVKDMMGREANSWYGLGPRINGSGESHIFHHGGANNSYRAWIEGHLETGDGIVILTNGTNGHRLYREIRHSAQQAFDWKIDSDSGFEEPLL